MESVAQIKAKHRKKILNQEKADNDIQRVKTFLMKQYVLELVKLDKNNQSNLLTKDIEDIVKNALRRKQSSIVLIENKKTLGSSLKHILSDITQNFIDKYWRKGDTWCDNEHGYIYYILDKDAFIENPTSAKILTKDDIKYICKFKSESGYDDYLEGIEIYKECFETIGSFLLPYIFKILKHANYKIYHPTKFFGLCKSNKLVLSLNGINIQDKKC